MALSDYGSGFALELAGVKIKIDIKVLRLGTDALLTGNKSKNHDNKQKKRNSGIPITELGGKPVTGTPVSFAKTHEVAEYDNWFLQEIENGLTEANDPETRWVSDDEANRSWEKKLTELIKSSLSARELLQKKVRLSSSSRTFTLTNTRNDDTSPRQK